MNFREVNKKLNDLKQAENAAKGAYLLSDYHSEEEILSSLDLFNVRCDLERFRNTKISEI
jgi:hypothetical protein